MMYGQSKYPFGHLVIQTIIGAIRLMLDKGYESKYPVGHLVIQILTKQLTKF